MADAPRERRTASLWEYKTNRTLAPCFPKHMYGTASWVHQVVYSLSDSARHSTQPRLEASSPTLRTVAAALRFIAAAADPPPASARFELGMHITLVLEALLAHIPDYPLATAALRFLLAAADPLPPSATPDVDVYIDIASASLCATGPTFNYCFSLRAAVGTVLGSLVSIEALSVLAVAVLPTPWFQDMAVRVFRHVSGIDHFEEQLRSEVAHWKNDIKNTSSRFADLGQEHQQVLARTTLGSALVKEHLRQHVFEDSGETLEGLRSMVARVERDRKAAEANAQQHSEVNARVLVDVEALERMAVPAIGDDLETLSVGDADVGALKRDLVAHTSATATVRADEQRQKVEQAAALAPLPGQFVCAMHELDSCQTRLDTVAAVDGDLQLALARVVSPVDAAHPSDLADVALDNVRERLRNITAGEVQECAIEERMGQLAAAYEIIEDTREARDFSENEYFNHIMVCSNEKDTLKQELDLHQYADNRREKEHKQTATAYTARKTERDTNIATLKRYTEGEGALEKRSDDEMAALEAEDAKITELEATVPGKTEELRQLRQQQDEADRARLAETNTATATDIAHCALIAHYRTQRTTADADEDAAAQTIADGRDMLAQTKASTADSSTHAATEHKVLEEKHRDGLVARQNALQNATAAEHSAIHATRVELLRIQEEAKAELAAKEDEKRAVQMQITPAINKKMKVQKEGDIDCAAYARKLEQLRTRNRELFAAMVAWDEAKKREYHTARALYDRVRKGKWAERPETPQIVQGSSRDGTPERDLDEGLAVARDTHAQESSRDNSRETTPEREGTPSLVADSESHARSPSLSPRLPATPSLEAVERLLPLEDFKTSLLEELPLDFDTY